MSRAKTSWYHKRIQRLIWLVLTVFVLLSCPLQSARASAHYSMVNQAGAAIDSPRVILGAGNYSGTTTIYANNTSANVNVTAPLFDYVDNDNSDEDFSSDKGTHSNFTAQQYSDLINDTLTEADQAPISGSENFVDSNTSNIDSHTGHGTSSNFTAQQDANVLYNDTLTEALVNSGGTNTWVQYNGTNPDSSTTRGTWSNFTAQTTTDTTNDTLTEGDSPSMSSFGNTATAGSSYSALAANEAVGGNFTSPAYAESIYNVTFYGRTSSSTHYANVIVTNNIGTILGNKTVSVTSTAAWRTATFTTPISISASTYYVLGIVVDTASMRLYYSSTSGGWQDSNLTNSYTNLKSPVTWIHANATNYDIYCNCSVTNYRLNLCENWTSAVYNESNATLCIRTGPLSAETILVHYWAGAAWTQLSAGLSANQWNNITIDSYLTSASFIIRFSDGTTTSDTSQGTWQIESVLIYSWNPTYELDYEFSWTTADFDEVNEYLCIRTNTFAGTAENLGVDVWTGTPAAWVSISSALTASQWNNISISSYLNQSTMYFRFIGKTESSDTAQNTWSVECNLIHVWSVGINYELDLEEQFTSANFSRTNEELCIRMGAMNGETLSVQWWNATGSSWLTIIASLTANDWNNVSVTSYLTSATFTIRYKGGTETGDTNQGSWQIDAALLHVWTESTYDHVLQVVNQVDDNWTINLQVYDTSNIVPRLLKTTISFHDGTSSDQIIVNDGAVTQTEGPPYSLTGNATVYISVSNLQSINAETSYLYVYLKIRIPNTTTYLLYVITFEIT
jgi:hypothetical protein